jgi:FkbM family methyltransferase
VTQRAHLAHYSLKHRITAAVSEGLFRNISYTVRHGLLKGMRRKGGLGFLPEWFPGAATPSPETEFWRAQDLTGQVVWDVGAFEGLLTMHFARTAAQVIAWEPNPGSRIRLTENLELNRLTNVRIRPLGVGRQPGVLDLVLDPLMPGGASADSIIASQIRSSLAGAPTTRIEIVTLDADRVQQQLPLPQVIKLDVEGMELQVLQGAIQTLQQARPALYLEMHGATPDDKAARARDILAFLHAHGYGAIYHVETRTMLGYPITAAELVTAASGHLYCRTRLQSPLTSGNLSRRTQPGCDGE